MATTPTPQQDPVFDVDWSEPDEADRDPVFDFDWSENTPEEMVTWLERQHARHGEEEDYQAAQLLKQLLAERAASPAPVNEQARLDAGKKQAKRLLKMARQGTLEVTALHQAQDVVARLHGYPDWQAWAARATQPNADAS
jgi:hypothetical protein